jgi:anti-anti-sigma factor
MTLGKLVMLNRKVQAANGRLTLCGLTPNVDSILETTRLKSLFNVYATEEEALKSFESEMLA